jgi:hypothetical protein
VLPRVPVSQVKAWMHEGVPLIWCSVADPSKQRKPRRQNKVRGEQVALLKAGFSQKAAAEMVLGDKPRSVSFLNRIGPEERGFVEA